MIVSAVIWIIGLVSGTVVPLLGGVRTARLGEIGFSIGLAGEIFMYLFGWMQKLTAPPKVEVFKGFRGPKRYGKKKDPA